MGSITVPIKGMHCKSCTVMVADELEKIPGIKSARVSLKSNSATIHYSIEPTTAQLRYAISQAGYEIGQESKPFFSADVAPWRQLFMNFAIIMAVIFFFSRFGLANLNFNSLSSNSGIMSLVVGLTAGFSTCMALVGGLVFGLSARFAEKHVNATPLQKFTPHLLFNLGRIVTFFVLGGVIGIFGSVFKLNAVTLGVLTILIGFTMIVLGLQLTDLFPRLSGKTITLPSGIAKFFGIKKHQNNEYDPKSALILGGLSFFLPCGFTQAMQLVAIASGNFLTGSLVMGMFAIGTAPGLLGVGGLTSIVKGKFSKYFFRFAGALVIALAIYNIWNGFSLTGFKPSFNFASNSQPVAPSGPATVLKTGFTIAGDISVKNFYAKAGQNYVLEVDASEDGQGCMSTIMIPGVYDTPVLIRKGVNRLEFIPKQAGDYQITCAMGVFRGTLHVR